MGDYADWCWKRISKRMKPQETSKTNSAFDSITLFFQTTKNGRKWIAGQDEYLLSKRKEYRINGVLDPQDSDYHFSLEHLTGGRMLLAKSAPCAFEAEKGFLGLCQEQETQYLVFFIKQITSWKPSYFIEFKFLPNSWVYQQGNKLHISTGQYPFISYSGYLHVREEERETPFLFTTVQFASEDKADYFKQCLLKLNFGNNVITEVFGPSPMDQLRRRGLIKDAAKSAYLSSQFLSKLKRTLTIKPLPDEKFASPVDPLNSCVLELNEGWVDALGTMLDELAYHSVAITVKEGLQNNLDELEKDVMTLNAIIHYCSCNEKTHKPVKEIEKQLREMRITIEAVKTLINMSIFYNSFKENLSNMAQDVREKIKDLPQSTRPVGSPAERQLRAVYSKIKKVPNVMKTNMKKKNYTALKNLPAGVLEYVDNKPIVNLMVMVLGYLTHLYLKTKDGTLHAEDFVVFDEVDRIVRAGRDSALNHFLSQFAKEIDTCARPMSSFFETGKLIFGEPSIVIIRDGEQLIVDELTQTKALDKIAFICCALQGHIKKKTEDLMELATLFTDSIIRFLDFDTKEWFELVVVAQLLKKHLQEKTELAEEANIRSPTTSEELSDFEVIHQTLPNMALKTDSSEETVLIGDPSYPILKFDHGTYLQLANDEFTERKSLAGGGYGAVTLEKHNYYGKVVVKIFHIEIQDTDVIRELENVKRLQSNPHIVKLIGFFYSSKEDFKGIPLGCVMEHIQMSLFDVMHRRRDASKEFAHEYNILKALKMIEAMASAFSAIHALRLMHRDVKPSNILVDFVDSEMVLKVCDLGTLGEQSVNPTNSIGTFMYRSPEMLGGLPYDCKTDVFSLAITIWELFHRKIPYANNNEVWDLIKERRRPEVASSSFRLVQDLVTKMWSQLPQDRPSMAEIEETAKDLIKGVEKIKDLALTPIR